MNCDKCQSDCAVLRTPNLEHNCDGFNRLCEKCWTEMNGEFQGGTEYDYLRKNEDGEWIGICSECDMKDMSLSIFNENWTIEEMTLYNELEEEGRWELRYVDWCLCEDCNDELREHIISEHLYMAERIERVDGDDDEDDDEDDEHLNPDPVNPDAPPYGDSSPTYEAPPPYDDDEPKEQFNSNWKPIMAKL